MTMPAGTYYVGDLCYVMSDEEWDDFCSITIKDNECLSGEFTMTDGRKFVTYQTQWGDGVYLDQYNNRYSVDAGLIGCILTSDIREEYTIENLMNLGNIVKFDRDFETSGGRGRDTWNGVIRIGHVQIETDPDIGDGLDDLDDWK